MIVGVVGVGYVGLVIAVALASAGHKVICYDIDMLKLEKLKKGEIPFFEPGLAELLTSSKENLTWSTDLSLLTENADLIFLCLPTPPKEDGSADTKHLFSVTKKLALIASRPFVLVSKSTVPVGTAKALQNLTQETLNDRNLTFKIDVASNPEFLREGNALKDFLFPDRIIIGIDHDALLPIFEDLYAPFCQNGAHIHRMDLASAELTKYAANGMLACRISFMNELARLSEQVNADIDKVRIALGSDPRIGPHFLYPGIGFGGSCFPKDLLALQDMFHSCDLKGSMIHAILEVNLSQKSFFLDKIQDYYGLLRGIHLSILGLSFKPETDDIRQAPSLYLIEKLLSLGVTLSLYDPVAMNNVYEIYGDHPAITWAKSAEQTLVNADGICLLTEWSEFAKIDFVKAKKFMKGFVLFDGRNFYDPIKINSYGFDYVGIGKKCSLTMEPV